MPAINRKQYAMLKFSCKQSVFSVDALDDNAKSICKYLSDIGFLDVTSRSIDDNFRSIPKSYAITQAGKAAIYQFKVARIKNWVPIVISIFALLISLASFIYSLTS